MCGECTVHDAAFSLSPLRVSRARPSLRGLSAASASRVHLGQADTGRAGQERPRGQSCLKINSELHHFFFLLCFTLTSILQTVVSGLQNIPAPCSRFLVLPLCAAQLLSSPHPRRQRNCLRTPGSSRIARSCHLLHFRALHRCI